MTSPAAGSTAINATQGSLLSTATTFSVRRRQSSGRELNGVKITGERISCVGCRENGVKTPFCESMCEIRKCVVGKQLSSCGKCAGRESCEMLKMIAGSNPEAVSNLKKKRSNR